MMREALFLIVLALVVWIGFDTLEGQRDTAREERDAAQSEVKGLREAARISGEMLAARDDIDRTRTQELNHVLAENEDLRRNVGGGDQRLLIRATCRPAMPNAARAARVADAGTAELATNARPDYFTLRDQLALSRQMILGLQDYTRQVCQRMPANP